MYFLMYFLTFTTASRLRILNGFLWVGCNWVNLVRRKLFAILYQPRMIDEYESFGGLRIGEGNRSTRKPAPLSLRWPQIPHDLSWDRTLTATVGSRVQPPELLYCHLRSLGWERDWANSVRGQMVNICSETSWFYKMADVPWRAECLLSLWTVACDSDDTLGHSHNNGICSNWPYWWPG
jgi:hypothetical protein